MSFGILVALIRYSVLKHSMKASLPHFPDTFLACKSVRKLTDMFSI